MDKIPDSILIKQEDTTFLIFITDDTHTCFICKQSDHISTTCKFNTENNKKINKSNQSIKIFEHVNTQQNTKALNDTNSTIADNSQPISYNDQDPHHSDYTNKKAVTLKRPASTSTCPNSPPSPISKIINNPLPPESDTKSQSNLKKQNQNKKQRVRNRTTSDSSSISILDTLDKLLEPCYECYDLLTQNPSLPIRYKSLKFIIENFSNKNLKINDLCNQVGTNASEKLNLLENIYPMLINRCIKIKVKKLTNLLFQVLPTEDNHTEQEI